MRGLETNQNRSTINQIAFLIFVLKEDQYFKTFFIITELSKGYLSYHKWVFVHFSALYRCQRMVDVAIDSWQLKGVTRCRSCTTVDKMITNCKQRFMAWNSRGRCNWHEAWRWRRGHMLLLCWIVKICKETVCCRWHDCRQVSTCRGSCHSSWNSCIETSCCCGEWSKTVLQQKIKI